MALPVTIDPNTPQGTVDPPSSIDEHLRSIKQLLVDLFGLAQNPVPITAAPFSFTAAGVASALVNPFTVLGLLSALGTITTDTKNVNVTATWNDLATVFTSILVNITDTLSNAESKIVELQVSASTKFALRKDGSLGLSSTDFGSGTGNIISINVATTAPTTNPASAFVIYMDPADSKLKCRGPSGTVTTLGNP